METWPTFAEVTKTPVSLLARRYTLMQQCWDDDPDMRPSFSDITTYLREHLALDPSNSQPERNSEADAYRPAAGNDAGEQVEMRTVIPGRNVNRNDYLSLHQSIQVEDYLAPAKA